MKGKTKIIIAGHSCSGKDYLRNVFIEHGLRPGISTTTRPKRNNETNGVEYHFITDDQYNKIEKTEGFFEKVTIGDYQYGMRHDDWRMGDVFIKTSTGIDNIPKEELLKCYIIFLNIPEDIRLVRMKEVRSFWNDIDRNHRIKFDNTEFDKFDKYHKEITDPQFDAKKLVEDVIDKMFKIQVFIS